MEKRNYSFSGKLSTTTTEAGIEKGNFKCFIHHCGRSAASKTAKSDCHLPRLSFRGTVFPLGVGWMHNVLLMNMRCLRHGLSLLLGLGRGLGLPCSSLSCLFSQSEESCSLMSHPMKRKQMLPVTMSYPRSRFSNTPSRSSMQIRPQPHTTVLIATTLEILRQKHSANPHSFSHIPQELEDSKYLNFF